MTISFIDLKAQYRELQSQIQGRISAVLEHGQYIMGPEVRELEERLEVYTGAKYCVSVSSGTEALLISLMALDVGPGDEVITTPFSFAATAEVIVLLGAKPVFVDIEPDTCNIDTNLIESAISERTRAIIPVSLYGQPANMDVINELAARYENITVIEDAAQSFGAIYRGRKSCNLSTIGCTSFFPSKPLGCYGDGGAIFTSNESLAKAMRQIRVHGQSERYLHVRTGVGGRMDTLQCAILLAKLDIFDAELKARSEIAEKYNLFFASHQAPRVIQKNDVESSFAQYTIFMKNRRIAIDFLEQNGIPTSVHYPIPLNEQPAFKHLCNEGETPIAKMRSKEVLSIPFSPYLKYDDQLHVINVLKQVYENELLGCSRE